MALANTTWDGYSPEAAWSPKAQAGNSFGSVVISALLVAVTAAAFMLSGAHIAWPPGGASFGGAAELPAAGQFTPPPAPSSQFDRDAAAFLHDSLALTGRCAASCYPVALEVAQARRLGRFGGAATGPTGIALQATFALPQPATPQPNEVKAKTAAALPPAAAAPDQPLPMRISPSIVVPLPPPALRSKTPTPALQQPGRLAEDGAALVASVGPADRPAAKRPVASPAPLIGRHDGVAVYDISAATVYMPDGRRIEAHSGLGRMVDNPHFVDRRNTGPTPPGTYRLVMRKGRFHGVEAIRMLPVDGKTRYGREGFLTHTYMLRGRPGQSNGCVVFPNYASFLNAFKRGHVDRLIVVASLKGTSTQVASAR